MRSFFAHHARAVTTGTKKRDAKRTGVKAIRCEDCFFHQNMLCALVDKRPCPTFRPAHPDGLRPPPQLSFVFRQERVA
jgi:hypothetical protein